MSKGANNGQTVLSPREHAFLADLDRLTTVYRDLFNSDDGMLWILIRFDALRFVSASLCSARQRDRSSLAGNVAKSTIAAILDNTAAIGGITQSGTQAPNART